MVDATTEIKAWHGTGDCGFAAFDVKQAGLYNLGLHFGTKEAAEKRFVAKLMFDAFRQLREEGRVKFLSYDELEKLYNCAIEESSLATQL